MSVYAKVIAHSINAQGDALATIEGRKHRYMLPEFNTHGVLARNSASSRARPVTKVLADVRENPAYPLTWRREQKGMQGGEHLSEAEVATAVEKWDAVMDLAITTAEELHDLGLHKSTTNRLIEPYAWHTFVCTGTAFGNFFEQRISDQAQDEIRAIAEAMRDALTASTPVLLQPGEWHLPYIDADTEAEILDEVNGDRASYFEMAVQVSAARCARVSYLTQDGVRDLAADLSLYERLVTANPPHWSPLEHVATPWPENRQSTPVPFTGFDGVRHQTPTTHLPRVGKLVGWRPLRTQVETVQNTITWR